MSDYDLDAEIDTSQWDKPDPWDFGSNNFHSATLIPDSAPVDQPDETSAVRTTDLHGVAHGVPTPSVYRNSADLFASNAAIQHQNALEDLKRALMAKPNVSPEQGIVASLLAAVPTLGGALIGSAVGRPTLPSGAFGVNMNNVELGSGAGMAAGAKVGGDAATQYLKTADTSPQEKAIALQKAEWEESQGNRLQVQSDQFNMKDLEVQQGADPVAEKRKIQNIEAEAKARQQGTEAGKASLENFSPQIQDAAASLLQGKSLTPEQAKVVAGNPDALKAAVEIMKANTQASNVKNQSTISPKDAMDIVSPVMIAKNLKESTDGLVQALGNNPDLASKAIALIPLGDPAYDYAQAMRIDALRLAKRFEGRMTEFTGQTYGDFVKSINTEPLSSVIHRSQMLQTMANQESKTNIDAIDAVGGKSTGNLGGFVDKTIAPAKAPMSEDVFIQKFLAAKAAQNGR